MERVDLDAAQKLLDEATEESGAWSIEVVELGWGLHIEAVGDGPEPGHATARFLLDTREREAAMVAELRVAGEVVDQVHSYAAAMRRDDGAGDIAEEWHRLGTALAAYDQATGQPATADQPPGEVA